MFKLGLNESRGFSLMEFMVVLIIVGILAASALPNIKVMDRPLVTAADELTTYLKYIRAKAISSTAAYKIVPTSANTYQALVANRCGSADFAPDLKFNRELPGDVIFESTEWELCLDSRGRASSNMILTLVDSEVHSRAVEVFLGGSVRVVSR